MAKQIEKKWIADGAIDGSKIKLLEGQSLVIEVAGQPVELLKLNQNGSASLPQGEVPSTQAVNQAIASEVSSLNTQIQTDIQTQIAAETTARQTAISSVEQSVSAETQARQTAISSVEQSVQSAQTDISGLESDIAQEILDRQSGDSSTLSSAQSYADGKLVEAKAYSDQKVADLVASAPAVLDTLNELALALGSDPSFATTVAGQIGSVDDKVDQEILDRQSGDSSTLSSAQSYADGKLVEAKAYSDTQDAAKLLEAKAYSDSLVSAINSSIDDLDAYAQDIRSDVDDIDAYAQDIRSDLDQEILDRASADDAKLIEAKAYADQKVADLVASAPEVLDTLNELAAALNDDPSFATTIAGQIGDLDSRLDALENAPDAVIFEEDIEFIVDGVNVFNTHIDLPHLAKAVLKVGVNRLNAYKTRDYTVSVVGGVTRITWTNQLGPSGLSEISGGDYVYVTYAR
jgi:hypothetical protein